MSAPFTSWGYHSFHGNDANYLFQRGHTRLQLFKRVLLHSVHPGGTSRNTNEIGFITAPQDGADGIIDEQKLVNSHAALVSRVVT